MAESRIRAWRVTVDSGKPVTFDDLDTALAYLRGYIGTNGSAQATLASSLMTRKRYRTLVEREDGN